MKFNVIETFNGGYRQVYQSEKCNNTEFDYRIYVEIINLSEATGDEGYILNVSVSKTSKFLTKKQKESIKESLCIDKISDYDVNEYGYSANIDGHEDVIKTEIKAIELANKLIEGADKYSIMFGFYMDKTQNRIGNTGWDFLNGKIG